MKRKGIYALTGIVCLLILMAFVFYPGGNEKKKLADMNEGECLDFLADMGVVIPSEIDVTKDSVTKGIKKTIADLEANPDKPTPVVDFTPIADFFEDIRGAVRRYYHLEPLES